MDPGLLRAADWIADGLRGFALASIALASAFYSWEGAAMFVLVFCIALVPRIADLPRPVDLALALVWLLTGWSNVTGLWITTSWADFVTHGITPGATAAAIYLLLVRVQLVPPLQQRAVRRAALVLITVALGVTIGVLWEFYEWIRFDESGPAVGYDDTIADLLMDSLGSLVAGLGLAVWAACGWGTRRLAVADVAAARG